MDWSHFLVDEKKRVYCISLLFLLRVQIALLLWFEELGSSFGRS
jgi:hypothetical protein